jgi:hypothetical protein
LDYSNQLDVEFGYEFCTIAIEDGLTDAGVTPNAPCKFNFNVPSVASFVSQAEHITAVMTSAFSDGTTLLTVNSLIEESAEFTTAIAMGNAVNRALANLTVVANPRGQSASPNEVTTIIQPFIGSCPSTNLQLPITAFPPLTVTSTGPFKQGQLVGFSVPNNLTLPPTSAMFVTFFSGGNTKTSVPVFSGNSTHTFSAAVGNNMAGSTFVVLSVVNDNSTTLPDFEPGIIAGPSLPIEVLPLTRNATVFDSGFPSTPNP